MGVLFRRLLGATLALLVIFPVYRLLIGREVGIFGMDVVATSDTTRLLTWLGTSIVVSIALILGRVIDPGVVGRRLAAAGARLAAISVVSYATLLALIATTATAWFSRTILGGRPMLIDAIAQLQQARYIAEGHLAGPGGPLAAFWHIQNALITDHGWVSQYPPGHPLLLGLGMALGAVWLVGPVLAGITAFFTALAADRLLPADRPVARVGALLAACSPLLIAQAGSYMNHISAAAFGAIALYSALRARDGRAAWALLTGAAAGGVFTVRPLAGIVVAVIALVAWMVTDAAHPHPVARKATAIRAGLAFVGAIPFGLLTAAYNYYFFGNPFRFGYVVAQGPSIGLGFHRDPWGNYYGVIDAIAYTSSDLTALSINLIESPLPVVVVIGLYLMVVRRLTAGERIVTVAAMLPVLANFVYWHHGLFMGPRMLAESAPVWALLTAIAAAGLVRSVPRERIFAGIPYAPRVALGSAFVMSWVAGVAYLAPARFRSYGAPWMASMREKLPTPREPSLVFVHGTWEGRVGAEIAAAGLRLDSLETLFRQNSGCEAQHFATAYLVLRHGERGAELPTLDMQPRSTALTQRTISANELIRVHPNEQFTHTCLREIAADTAGTLDVTPYLWQHDLPGLRERGTMFVRDLGPARDAELIARYPRRRPLMLVQPNATGVPTLLPYSAAVRTLYGEQAP